MTNRLSTLLMVSAAMLLASCSNGLTCGNSHPYANYNPAPPLKAPPGVTVPTPDPAYVVPAGSTKPIPAAAAGTLATATPAPAASTNGAQPCLVTPPNVLTKADMAAPPKTEAPAKKAIPSGTRPSSSGHPPPEQGQSPPPVADREPME